MAGKKQNINPQRVAYCENYLRSSMAAYPIEDLKSALLAGGYSEAEVKQAEKNIKNPAPMVSRPIDPLDISYLLTNTWNFLKTHIVLLFSIQFVAAVPSILLQMLNQESLAEISRINENDPDLILEQFRGFFTTFMNPLNVSLVLLTIILAVLGVVALYRAIVDLDQGESLDIQKAYENAMPFVFSYLGASILYGLAVIFGIILLIVPGIIFLGWFIFFGFTVVYEKKGAVESLSRSKELVRGNWWGIVGRYLLGSIILGVVVALPNLLSYMPFFGPIFQGAIQSIGSVFMTVYLYNIYKGLRVIKG